MSDELEALTNEIMADLLDRNGILDGVGDDMLAEITATVAGVVGQARAAGATAEKARVVALIEAEAQRRELNGDDPDVLAALNDLLEKVNEA